MVHNARAEGSMGKAQGVKVMKLGKASALVQTSVNKNVKKVNIGRKPVSTLKENIEKLEGKLSNVQMMKKLDRKSHVAFSTMPFAAGNIHLHSIEAAVAMLQDAFGEVNGKNSVEKSAQHIYIVISLLEIIPIVNSKVIPVPLPHPFITASYDVCVITRDPKKVWTPLFAEATIPGLCKILSLSELRSEFSTFKDKRDLCNSYDIFFCDSKIVEMMPQTLGKHFIKAKKLPIPCKVRQKDVQSAVCQSLKCAHIRYPRGSCATVKIATLNMSPQHVAENVATVLKSFLKYLHKKDLWKNSITGVSLQAGSSLSAPLFRFSVPSMPNSLSKHDKNVNSPKGIKGVKSVKSVKNIKSIKDGKNRKSGKGEKNAPRRTYAKKAIQKSVEKSRALLQDSKNSSKKSKPKKKFFQ